MKVKELVSKLLNYNPEANIFTVTERGLITPDLAYQSTPDGNTPKTHTDRVCLLPSEDALIALAEKDKEIERLQRIINGVIHHLSNHPLGRARTGEKTVVEIAEIIRYDAEQSEKDREIHGIRTALARMKDAYDNKSEEIQQWRDMCRRMDLQLRELLMSADCEWENKRQGHDWAEACESTRKLLAAYIAMKDEQPEYKEAGK